MGLGIAALLGVLPCLLSLAAGRVAAPITNAAAAGVVASCSPDWRYYEGSCYRLSGEPASWTDAVQHCRDLGSELVSVHSAGENSFVYNLWRSSTKTSDKGGGLWIGLSDRKQEGKFVFTDGSKLDFAPWDGINPSGGGENCVHFYVSKRWNDLSCGYRLPYVCELNSRQLQQQQLKLLSLAAGRVAAPITNVAAAGVVARCPPYWTYYEDTCYRMFGELASWTDADKHCRDLGSELVSVHSAGENSFVYNLWRSGTQKSSVGYGVWIGLSDRTKEGKYVFTDGSKLDFSQWENREPSGGGEDCIHFWYRNPETDVTKRWNDIVCTRKLAYVCELNPGQLQLQQTQQKLA